MNEELSEKISEAREFMLSAEGKKEIQLAVEKAQNTIERLRESAHVPMEILQRPFDI